MKKTWGKVLALVAAVIVTYMACLSLVTRSELDAIKTAVAEGISKPETLTKVMYTDDSVYTGDLDEYVNREGTGTLEWSTGESYTGEWENGAMNGNGVMTWPGLGTYEGAFADGKRDGKGTFTWTYEGEPNVGDPVKYEGDWTKDQIGPKGTVIISGVGTYFGEFKDKKRHGTGTFTWENGDKYEGAWANDQITGKGMLTLANGMVIEGTFNNGKVTAGTMTYEITNGTATRNINGGKLTADATVKYSDGTEITGKTKNSEFTGNVTIKYANGEQYTGGLVNGKKSGKGTYKWKNGAHYVGNWENDKMNGQGKYYYGSSETVEYLSGTFKNGAPDGTLTYVKGARLKYETKWENGTCTSVTYKK